MVFFFNDTATTEIYTLSLHDALPILAERFGVALGTVNGWLRQAREGRRAPLRRRGGPAALGGAGPEVLSALVAEQIEEHTSELQSRQYLVCRLLLEKKKNIQLYT